MNIKLYNVPNLHNNLSIYTWIMNSPINKILILYLDVSNTGVKYQL